MFSYEKKERDWIKIGEYKVLDRIYKIRGIAIKVLIRVYSLIITCTTRSY